jgi:hypothetical protein
MAAGLGAKTPERQIRVDRRLPCILCRTNSGKPDSCSFGRSGCSHCFNTASARRISPGDPLRAMARAHFRRGLRATCGASAAAAIARDTSAWRRWWRRGQRRRGRSSRGARRRPAAGPVDHPDSAHVWLTGTGLTHLGSAEGRDKMHRAAAAGEDADRLLCGCSSKVSRAASRRPASRRPAPSGSLTRRRTHIAGPGDERLTIRRTSRRTAARSPSSPGIYLIGPDACAAARVLPCQRVQRPRDRAPQLSVAGSLQAPPGRSRGRAPLVANAVRRSRRQPDPPWGRGDLERSRSCPARPIWRTACESVCQPECAEARERGSRVRRRLLVAAGAPAIPMIHFLRSANAVVQDDGSPYAAVGRVRDVCRAPSPMPALAQPAGARRCA